MSWVPQSPTMWRRQILAFINSVIGWGLGAHLAADAQVSGGRSLLYGLIGSIIMDACVMLLWPEDK